MILRVRGGSVLLETALVLPLLLTLLIGSLEIGLCLYDRSFVAYAATSGAQFIVAKNPPGQVRQYILGLASGMHVPRSEMTVTFSRAPGDMSSCPPEALAIDAWCVAVSMPYRFIIPFVKMNPITLAAQSQAAGSGEDTL